jgi:hypothetical protein
VADKRDKGGESFNGLDSQRAAIVAQFVDGIASEQHKGGEGPLSSTPPVLEDNNDDDVMKKLGIPTTFNTTKVTFNPSICMFSQKVSDWPARMQT